LCKKPTDEFTKALDDSVAVARHSAVWRLTIRSQV